MGVKSVSQLPTSLTPSPLLFSLTAAECHVLASLGVCCAVVKREALTFAITNHLYIAAASPLTATEKLRTRESLSIMILLLITELAIKRNK